METINTKMLGDETIYPDDTVLAAILGESYGSYRKLIDLFDEMGMTSEWRYYNDGKAWLCKVQHKKRTIVWMSAWKDYMQATVYYPLSKIGQVMDLELKAETKEKIDSAKNVGKSKPCMFEIKNDDILSELRLMMELKIKTK